MSEKVFAIRSLMHRTAGVVMTLVSVYHLYYILFVKRGRRFAFDMMPRLADVRGFYTQVKYYLGLSKTGAQFHRFGYAEKAEYWALVWGVVVMAGTGAIMWFDNFFINLLTKLGWDIARTIHYYEACLATLAILVWHFYFVIFNPDVYPMNTAWWNGKLTEEEMAADHPLELAQIRSEQLKQFEQTK
jgi:cytochrome b subunit of formate dehydrogenase